MTDLKKYLVAGAVTPLLLIAAPATAQDKYISISGAIGSLSDSDNVGSFSEDFLTGEGSDDLPFGTPLPTGTDVGWETEFETAYGVNAAFGKRYGNIRVEGELAYDTANVDTHVNVSAAGLDLSDQDAAVLISGQEDELDIDVDDLVADGQGDIKTTSVFLNAYYDVDMGNAITPYVGAGIGYGWTDVDYSPSATPIIDDDDSGFAWQVMGGVSVEVTPTGELFGGVRYRQSADADVNASLFPAEFEIENKRTLFEVGYRFGF